MLGYQFYKEILRPDQTQTIKFIISNKQINKKSIKKKKVSLEQNQIKISPRSQSQKPAFNLRLCIDF